MARSVHKNAIAPAFSGTDQAGRTWSSQALRGGWVLLYFYPKDETRGCTLEACAFRDAFPELRQEGVTVLGVSRDSDESHRSFAARHHLPFPLLSDPDRRIIDAFGARGWFGVARRVSFLIDPNGRVAKTYRVRRWSQHASDVLRDVRDLKSGNSAANPTKPKPSNGPI